ncbi:MAG: hypothetical protein ACR2RB_17905 [Gammaproteobacteria bacterium]
MRIFHESACTENIDLSVGAGWLLPLRRILAVRALLFGLAGLALAVSVLVGLALVGLTNSSPMPLVWAKASYTALLGALVTPIIALLALADIPLRQRGPIN